MRRSSHLLLALFATALVAEHALRPGLGITDHRISEYAVGSHGGLMTVGFAAWAASLACASVALGHLPKPRLIAVAFAIAAVGAAATATFKTGTSAGRVPTGHTLTTENHLHDYGSSLLALALWATVVFALPDRKLRAVAVAMLSATVAIAVSLSGTLFDLPGLRQRMFVLAAVAWQVVVLERTR